RLTGGNEFGHTLYAMDGSGVVSAVATYDSPEGAAFVPTTMCNMTGTTGSYFISMKDMNQIYKFPASQFAGLSGQALVPSEESTVKGIGLFSSDGSTITV